MKFELPYEQEDMMQLNMTPMIDVVFLLTIFFLASASLSVGEGDQEVELPEASEARLAERLNPDSVTIDVKSVPMGAVFVVSGKGYSYGDLLRKLRTQVESAALRNQKAPPIILRADYRVPYKQIQELMFDCASMGIEVFDFQAETGREGRP